MKYCFVSFKLLVEPPPPINITYSDLKETRVHVYWKPPELSELFYIERYFIVYRKHGEKKWSNGSTSANLLHNFQVDNLESDTFYFIVVIAENEYGLGKESSRIEIKTKKINGLFSILHLLLS